MDILDREVMAIGRVDSGPPVDVSVFNRNSSSLFPSFSQIYPSSPMKMPLSPSLYQSMGPMQSQFGPPSPMMPSPHYPYMAPYPSPHMQYPYSNVLSPYTMEPPMPPPPEPEDSPIQRTLAQQTKLLEKLIEKMGEAPIAGGHDPTTAYLEQQLIKMETRNEMKDQMNALQEQIQALTRNLNGKSEPAPPTRRRGRDVHSHQLKRVESTFQNAASRNIRNHSNPFGSPFQGDATPAAVKPPMAPWEIPRPIFPGVRPKKKFIDPVDASLTS